jgi:hypothetical protein
MATDQFQELTLYRSGYALVLCANFGDGELGFERIDHQSAVLTCTGPDHDKDRDNVDDRDERRRGRN